MAPISMISSDLLEGHDIIQRQITRKRNKIELWLQRRTNRKSYMVYRTAPFSMTLSYLWRAFQGHDNIERQITRLIESRLW